MVTMHTLKESKADATTSQQRLWSTIYEVRNQVDVCSVRIPSEIDLAQSNQGRELHCMATLHRAQCQKVLPRNCWDPKETPQPNQEECVINKPKWALLEHITGNKLKGKKVRNVFTKVYDVRNIIFYDQTGKFPKQSQQVYKYIMVMVEIDSNGILVEPITSQKDA